MKAIEEAAEEVAVTAKWRKIIHEKVYQGLGPDPSQGQDQDQDQDHCLDQDQGPD